MAATFPDVRVYTVSKKSQKAHPLRSILLVTFVEEEFSAWKIKWNAVPKFEFPARKFLLSKK